LNSFKIFLILVIFLISCDDNVTEKQVFTSSKRVKISLTERNKKDEKFKLVNGVLFYNSEPYSGIVKENYADEHLKSTSEYYKGKREGKYFGFYPNGLKWFERYYANGIKIKVHKSWYQDEQQMFEYQFNGNGVYHGYTKDWHFNGQLAKYFNFDNGIEKGSQKMWKPDGKIRANFFTVNGERHGLIGLKNCVSVLKEIE
jgi:antitoxin component YwqK of YwqJK toxin-antitoxin module